MNYETSYIYAIGLINANYALTSEVVDGVTTWTLKENQTLVLTASEFLTSKCMALNNIITYLKNPSFFDSVTTAERDALQDVEECKAVYNSDTKSIDLYHNSEWI